MLVPFFVSLHFLSMMPDLGFLFFFLSCSVSVILTFHPNVFFIDQRVFLCFAVNHAHRPIFDVGVSNHTKRDRVDLRRISIPWDYFLPGLCVVMFTCETCILQWTLRFAFPDVLTDMSIFVLNLLLRKEHIM